MRKYCCFVVALGVFAFAVTAVAGPPQARIVDEEWISPQELAKLPEITVYSEQSKAAGDVATGATQTYAYRQSVTEESGYFTNLEPTGGYDLDVADNPLMHQGAFFAEDMTLANGFRPGIDALSGYMFRFFRSSRDPDTTHLATIHMELWDGDPLGIFDTAGGGYTATKIAGTESDFPNIPVNFRINAVAVFPSEVVIPRETVWLVITADACRLGFMNGGVPPTIGTSREGWIMQEDDDGSFNGTGFCCDDANPHACLVGGTICADDTDGTAHMCSDGLTEVASFAAFSSPTYFNCEAHATTDTLIYLQPVGASVAHTISGNEITIPEGPAVITMEMLLDGWDADLDNTPALKTWQGQIDSAGYTSGLQGLLTPYGPACTPPTFPDPDMCVALLGPGSICDVPPAPETPIACTPGFQDKTRTDYVMTMCAAAGVTDAVDISTLDYRYGGNATPPCGVYEIYFGAAPGVPAYGGTLVLDASWDCKGTFTVDFVPDPFSFMKDINNAAIPLLGLVPGKITCEVGKCCTDIGGADPDCIDNQSATLCAGFPGTSLYFPGEYCTGDLAVDCPSCLVNDDCKDPHAGQTGDDNLCTDNICDTGTGICSNPKIAAWTDTVNDCCHPDTAVIAARDSGDQCRAALCDMDDAEGYGSPDNSPLTAGTPCNDGGKCTYDDECDGAEPPVCVGLDVNLVACTSSDSCLATTGVAWDCVAGYCECIEFPPLTFVKIQPPVNNCYEEQEKVYVNVHVGISTAFYGAQFTVKYDPTCLDFVSIAGLAPYDGWTAPGMPMVDEPSGTIFHVVGVDPFAPPDPTDPSLTGNSDIAALSFNKIGDCNECNLCFGGQNPVNTYLVDVEGQAILVDPYCSKDILDLDHLWLKVPDDITVNADCDFDSAEVYWDAPTAGTDCPVGDLVPVCWGSHEGGYQYPQSVVQNGGEMPQGVSTFECYVDSPRCGQRLTDGWTVTVSDQQTFDVTVQLQPLIAAAELSRCIKFELFSDCVTDPIVFSKPLVFGGLWDWTGHFTDTFKYDKGQYACMTARDQLHTLRGCAMVECIDGIYYVVFKGDPLLGGNWLIGGNLDGFKKDVPEASHDVIDILDFGMFVGEYTEDYGTGDTTCATAGPHADINGDGEVDTLDFAFIEDNFLAHSKDCCCGGVASIVGRTEVSVRELRLMGMGDLAVADLNRDGLVNMDDMTAFLAGERPTKKVPTRDIDSSRLGSSR